MERRELGEIQERKNLWRRRQVANQESISSSDTKETEEFDRGDSSGVEGSVTIAGRLLPATESKRQGRAQRKVNARAVLASKPQRERVGNQMQ